MTVLFAGFVLIKYKKQKEEGIIYTCKVEIKRLILLYHTKNVDM